MREQLVLRHKWALGDTVLLTGLVRDIHKAYPDRFDIKVETHWAPVWLNNPYVTKFVDNVKTKRVEISWADAIRQNSYALVDGKKVKKHILAWYHYDFGKKTGLHVPVTEPKPDLHLTPEERRPILTGNYWVILSGGKLDMTTKHWHAHRAQEVVNRLKDFAITCVQVGATHENHIHPPLQNTINLIGRTENVRDLWNIILHSKGVICGVTGAMHIAAAFNKPCVVYAGGREEPWFEAYTNEYAAFGPEANKVEVEHKFLHTLGQLPCCDVQGCWKKRTVPLDAADQNKRVYTLCRMPVKLEGKAAVPACQDLITVDQVVEAVMSYEQNPDFKLYSITHIKADNVQVQRTPTEPPKPQKPYQAVYPKEFIQLKEEGVTRKLAIMDDPIIGGKLTVFVLCYGDHSDIAKKCLGSLLKSMPIERLDIRVATNMASQDTIQYLKTLPITKLYINSENRYKYPVMREILRDKQCPIKTSYFLWLDDDTWVINPNWIQDLCQNIISMHDMRYRMYGTLMYHDLAMYNKPNHDPRNWFRKGSWHKGIDFRVKSSQQEAPNGSVIDFAVGYCWAMATHLIEDADIPDRRLEHNGGDITIGEQVHQAGYLIRNWNRGKQFITCPTRQQGGRRGFSQKFPWDYDAKN
jgi:ADP-heptose:LPS heptosyltransferase